MMYTQGIRPHMHTLYQFTPFLYNFSCLGEPVMLWNKDFTRVPLRFSIMDNLLEIKFFSQNLHAFIVFFIAC